jgi:hypothetical protein
MDERDVTGSAGGGTAPFGQERRRFARYDEPVAAAQLVEQSLRSAELQLLDAREALKEARRRVVQLEDALAVWHEVREELRRAADLGRVTAN